MASTTRMDALLTAIKNHKIASVLLVAVIGIVGAATLVSAIGTLRSAATPAPRPNIAGVRIGQGPSKRQYEITLGNPSGDPTVITHVRVLEQSSDSAWAAPLPAGVTRACANGPVYFLADDVSLGRRGDTTRLSGAIGQENNPMSDYPTPAYGWMYEECGGADRQFVLDFDVAVSLPPHDNTTFYVRIPNQLRVRPDSFQRRFDVSLQHFGGLLARGNYFASVVPRGSNYPATWLDRPPVNLDSLLYPTAAVRLLPRLHIVNIVLLTNDSRRLVHVDTVR